MNPWRLTTPRKWWNGHHWRYVHHPYVSTCRRDCKRCGKSDIAVLHPRYDYFVWKNCNKGDASKVCQESTVTRLINGAQFPVLVLADAILAALGEDE